MRIFVGAVKSISPFFGQYTIDLYQSIDTTNNTGIGYAFNQVITGIAATGVI